MLNTSYRFVASWLLFILGDLVNRLNRLVPDWNHALTASTSTFLYSLYQYMMLKSCILQHNNLKYWPWK